MTTWVQFFKDAAIPNQFANVYANKFSENRIRFDMLIDLDRALLNELGISAIGDCLSILKHAKAVNSKVEENKKELLYTPTNKSSESQLNELVKKKSDVVKRVIESFSSNIPTEISTSSTVKTSLQDTLSPSKNSPVTLASNPSTSSTLSQNLASRLNFSKTTTAPESANTTASTTTNPNGSLIIKFNNDASQSNHQAKVVSSTTQDHDDDDDEDFSQSNRLKNLKRRIHNVYDNSESETLTKKSVGKIISLKPKRTTSFNEATSTKPTTVISTKAENRRISSDLEGLRIELKTQNDKKSVFNRIRSTNEPKNNQKEPVVTVKNSKSFESHYDLKTKK
jgi:hypothetical protein